MVVIHAEDTFPLEQLLFVLSIITTVASRDVDGFFITASS